VIVDQGSNALFVLQIKTIVNRDLLTSLDSVSAECFAVSGLLQLSLPYAIQHIVRTECNIFCMTLFLQGLFS